MEFNGGPYGRDPYGYGPADRSEGDGQYDRGQDDYARPGDDYGRSTNPYGQSSSYGRDAYDGAPADPGYGQGGYPGSDTGRIRYEQGDNTGRMRYEQGDNTGRMRYEQGDNTGRMRYEQGDNTGRTYMGQADGQERGGYERGYARDDAPRDGYYERRGDDYERADVRQGGYEREYYGDDAGRRDYARAGGRRDYEQDGEDREDESAYDEDRGDERRTSARRKKKRSTVSRFFRGLGAYISQLPTKTLILFGGSVAVVLVAVILLVVLLPKSGESKPADNGQLTIADITPTPSLAPTAEPTATPEPSPTQDPDPLNGVQIKLNETNDVIPAVQERLVELGYMTMPDGGYTNKFGPTTRTAFRLFQIKNYSSAKEWDGILGSKTYNLLMSDTAQAYYLARGDGDDRTKEITKLVEDVTKLQNRLIELGYLAAGSATGVYGTSTATAVKTFQQYHGLKQDGQAGQATMTQLYASDAMDAATGAANDKSKLPSASPDAAATAPDASAPVTTTDPSAAAEPTGTGTVVN